MKNKKLLSSTTRPPPWLTGVTTGLMAIAFAAFVGWIFNGAARGGWFPWAVLALFAVPVTLYLGFIALVAASFVRDGRASVREARRQRVKR